MSNRTFQGNDGIILLHPHTNGYWQLSSPWCWKYPIDISTISININGAVTGGQGGYTLIPGQ